MSSSSMVAGSPGSPWKDPPGKPLLEEGLVPTDPYDHVDAILNDSSFAEGYEEPTWPNGYKQGRHVSFFEMHFKWYFAASLVHKTENREGGFQISDIDPGDFLSFTFN